MPKHPVTLPNLAGDPTSNILFLFTVQGCSWAGRISYPVWPRPCQRDSQAVSNFAIPLARVLGFHCSPSPAPGSKCCQDPVEQGRNILPVGPWRGCTPGPSPVPPSVGVDGCRATVKPHPKPGPCTQQAESPSPSGFPFSKNQVWDAVFPSGMISPPLHCDGASWGSISGSISLCQPLLAQGSGSLSQGQVSNSYPTTSLASMDRESSRGQVRAPTDRRGMMPGAPGLEALPWGIPAGRASRWAIIICFLCLCWEEEEEEEERH